MHGFILLFEAKTAHGPALAGKPGRIQTKLPPPLPTPKLQIQPGMGLGLQGRPGEQMDLSLSSSASLRLGLGSSMPAPGIKRGLLFYSENRRILEWFGLEGL